MYLHIYITFREELQEQKKIKEELLEVNTFF
jgi:hypothetical protein